MKFESCYRHFAHPMDFFGEILNDFEKIQEAKVHLSQCQSVCVSLTSDSSKTIKVIIIKLGMVTASDMVMHHVLIILTVTFTELQGYIDLNHENNKCLIISETV